MHPRAKSMIASQLKHLNFRQIKSDRSIEFKTKYWSTLSSTFKKMQFCSEVTLFHPWLYFIPAIYETKISNHNDLQTEVVSVPSEWQLNFKFRQLGFNFLTLFLNISTNYTINFTIYLLGIITSTPSAYLFLRTTSVCE